MLELHQHAYKRSCPLPCCAVMYGMDFYKHLMYLPGAARNFGWYIALPQYPKWLKVETTFWRKWWCISSQPWKYKYEMVMNRVTNVFGPRNVTYSYLIKFISRSSSNFQWNIADNSDQYVRNTDENEAIKRKMIQDGTATLSIFWIGSLIQFYFGRGRLIGSIVLMVTNKETRPHNVWLS